MFNDLFVFFFSLLREYHRNSCMFVAGWIYPTIYFSSTLSTSRAWANVFLLNEYVLAS